jgi:hypothetical protein
VKGGVFVGLGYGFCDGLESDIFTLRGVSFVVGQLEAYVVGPTDDADRVEAAGAAGLVPVHPAVGHAVSGFDRRGEDGDEVSRCDVLDGRDDSEARNEDGQEDHNDEVSGGHHDVCWFLYQGKCISVCRDTKSCQM